MSEAKLDQIVKGAPAAPTNEALLPATIPFSSITNIPPSSTTAPILPPLSDPLASLPSSPPQIYLNLLILEASLRAQYLELRARRRQYTFFLALLGVWNLYFAYALFLAPREDGSGVGGSVYWVIEVTEKVAFMGGIVTGILVWGTGQWERGIRWPRRWVGITNRGLRGFNCKLVVVKGPWWREWLATIAFFFSHSLFLSDGGSSYRHVDPELLAADAEKNAASGNKTSSSSGLPNIHEDDQTNNNAGYHLGSHEEDLAPGGDTIKLLLLPKPFSPAFRENWDLYRAEYWERENERRALLSARLKLLDRHRPRPSSPGLLARLGLVRTSVGGKDVEKSSPHHQHVHHPHHAQAHHRPPTPDNRRLRSAVSASGTNSASHSRTSSRSSTPAPDLRLLDDGHQQQSRTRRSSTASTSSNSSSLRGVRNSNNSKKKGASQTLGEVAAGGGGGGGGQRVQKLTPTTKGGEGAGSASPLGRRAAGVVGTEDNFSSEGGGAGTWESRPGTPTGGGNR